MKWWYVGALLVGVGIGGWIVKNNSTKKIMPVAEKGVVEKNTTDAKGKEVKTVEISGVVEKWQPESGMIEFRRDNKLEKLTIDPTEAIVFVPSLKDKTREIKISDKSNVHWSSAFCPGDMVVFREADDKVILVSNSGYRACGFKGD